MSTLIKIYSNSAGIDIGSEKVFVSEENQNSAGLDIGSEKVFVSEENQTVGNFKTFTYSYRELSVYLCEYKITHVSMEATGIY